MQKKTKKKQNRNPSVRRLLTLKILSENVGMSVGEAKRLAGYSVSESLQPQRTTNTKAYRDILDEAGLNDKALAKGHKLGYEAVEIKEREFRDISREELVEIDEDDPGYIKEGRAKQFKEVTVYTAISDKEIKDFFKRIPNAKLIRLEHRYRHKVAIYTVPQHAVRVKYQELGYKVKGHMAAEQHNVHVVEEASEEEKQIINSIFNQNN